MKRQLSGPEKIFATAKGSISKTRKHLMQLNTKKIRGGFIGSSVVKNLPANAADTASIIDPKDPTTTRESGPCLPQLEKSSCNNKEPA